MNIALLKLEAQLMPIKEKKKVDEDLHQIMAKVNCDNDNNSNDDDDDDSITGAQDSDYHSTYGAKWNYRD